MHSSQPLPVNQLFNQKEMKQPWKPFQASLPLNQCNVQTRASIINRIHTFLHSLALLSLIHFRLSRLIELLSHPDTPITFIFLWLLVFSSELLLSFMWLQLAAFGWRPVHRTVFPERLPESEKLPSIDVFICTTDPEREPTLGVMNTVLSAMALDYPTDKLNVYLSDDGGFSATLSGLREVSQFGKSWIPFCRTYGIKCGCPDAYFSKPDDHDHMDLPLDSLFMNERHKIQREYELFKSRILRAKETTNVVNSGTIGDHNSFIEVIEGDRPTYSLPLLAYVAREKRSSHPHNFKAGALNALIRVSGIISNSPYMLVLDCDMYCNDSSSAKQSMCFHLDPNMSGSLAFVQFPQRFHTITVNDIYDSQLRSTFKALWPGVDGFGGPILTGTGFYLKREALYHPSSSRLDLTELRNIYGPSNEFIRNLCQLKETANRSNSAYGRSIQDEAQGCLASCKYEEKTKWGNEVGFMYGSVVEDFFTGMKLHSEGWTSAYFDPVRPQFLGHGVTNLNDLLVQGTRWSSGLIDIALNQRTCVMLSRMSLVQAMCYSMIAYIPFSCIPLWCFATIPQLCLLNGIGLYPQISSSWHFLTFIFIFLSSNLKYLKEVLETGGSINRWKSETRVWMIQSITCNLYGTLDAILKKIGAREASFMLTNKTIDKDQIKLYHADKFNFQASEMFVGPLVFIVSLNAISLVVGSARVLILKEWDTMCMQLLICFYASVMSWPVIEAMLIRKDKGRIGPDVALKWAGLSLGLIVIGATTAWPT